MIKERERFISSGDKDQSNYGDRLKISGLSSLIITRFTSIT